MLREIDEIPEVLGRLLARRSRFAEVARVIRARAPRMRVLIARGSSDHAAVYAKYLAEIRLGLPTALYAPSTTTMYDATLDLRDALVIGVSQSGGSPDLVEPMTRARASGAITLAITNAPGSPLAEAAELSIDLEAGEERAVAATKSYVAELLALFLLLEALGDRDGSEANAIDRAAREQLDRDVSTIAARYRFADQLVTTARGYAYTTALEASLKLMETSYLVAHAFSGADLLHGPMAMIERGFPTIAIVPEGRSVAAMREVLATLTERGADRLVIGAELPANVHLPLVEVPEVVAPIVAILPLQQLALHLALQRGIDPDHPRGLSKITRTW
jgi:glucosamine--fructose-6-phosphate aminotransferase (isomerizing)